MSSTATSPVAKDTPLANPPTDGISSLRFSSSGPSLLACSSWDCTVRVYDPATNTLIGSQKQQAPVLDVVFGESARVFGAGLSREVILHDFEASSAGVNTFIGRHDDAVKALEYSDTYRIVVSGSWDRTVRAWDPRKPGTPTCHIAVPERVYCVTQAGPNVLIVGTAGRRVLLYDIRKMTGANQGDNPLKTAPRESSLKHQTRVVRGFPDGSGYATGSIEGRVAIDYVDDSPAVQAAKYSFKCHRAKQPNGEEKVHPVHAIAFHPGFGTFATGGGDGMVCVWDGAAKKRLCQYRDYGTSISSLAFSRDGSQLAIAASYMYEQGEREHPADAIFIRSVADADVRPKAPAAPKA